jgi:nitroreductase
MNVKEAIVSRQSIREYDPNVKIPLETINEMLDLASRAPSSWNLQPWRFVVVTSPDMKEALKPCVMFNTTQLATSSAMILILQDWKRYELFPILNDLELKAGYITQEQFNSRQLKAEQAKTTITKENLERTGLLDCGLIAQNFMLIAREYGYDTCPMGGFDRPNTMKVLGLDTERYSPVVLLSLGKRKGTLKTSLRFPLAAITTYK